MKNLKISLLFVALLLSVGMARGQKYNIYLGNTHAHCNFSGDVVKGAARNHTELDPQNNVENNIAMAREVGMQFYCVTDHSQFDCYTPQAWATIGEWAEKLTENGKFVALRGFEYSRDDNANTDGKGHMNVYNTPQFVSAAIDAYDLHKFQDWLTLPENRGALVCFNHPRHEGYNNFAIYNPEAKSKFAMIEVINGQTKEPIYYDRFLDVLALGYKVSPVAGLDNHAVDNLKTRQMRTGIAATSLTAEGVLDAFAGRRTYATLDRELKVYYTVNGKAMGSTLNLKKGQLKFDIEASTGAAAISKIEIVGEGGKVILSKDFANAAIKWNVAVPLGQKYYFLILYEKGAETPVAWVAPVWVE